MDEITDLYRQGIRALDNGAIEEAHRIADELASKRNTGAYEIGARAHWQAGEGEEAIKLLRVGITRFPQVAILWSYLGEYLSDMGQYDEAIEAFYRSATGHGGSQSLADRNIALVQWRRRDYDAALKILDETKEGNADYRVLELRATILVDMGRFVEANEVLENLAVTRPRETTARDLALMFGLMAAAELGLGNRKEALRLARECLQLDPDQIRGKSVLNMTS